MPYIICGQTKSEYRVSVDICANCPKNKKCGDYRHYIQPALFATWNCLPTSIRKNRTKRNKTMTPPATTGAFVTPEQLSLWSEIV